VEIIENEPSLSSQVNPIAEHLSQILKSYLSERPNLSLNGLSKRCKVSEPTLRRILKGQVKTLPNYSTILDILTVISGEKSVTSLLGLYPGPAADFIRERLPHLQECGVDYDPQLNDELKNPAKYIIYKLASNSSGVTEQTVSELFGAQGAGFLEELINKKFIERLDGRIVTLSKNFATSHLSTLTNFKTVADFIKVRPPAAELNLSPVIANYSDSVSLEAYKKIVLVQKKALEKIRQLMQDNASVGDVPIFVLSAIDTLSNQTAFEMRQSPR